MNTKAITKTISNGDINIIYEYMNGRDYCFSKENLDKNNNKIDTRLSWIMRKNRKAILDVYSMIQEARKEIEMVYVEAGKIETITDDEGNETTKIAKAYENEFIKEIDELFKQTNEITITAISMEDLFDYSLAELDLDVLSFMIYDIDDEVNDTHDERDKVEVTEHVEAEVVE